MAVKIGSARSSFGNTKAGDQNGGKEVSTQNWYKHSKGWVVIRAKDPVVREKLAVAMQRACDNNNIGYDQSTRLTLFNNIKDKGFDPAKTTKKVNTDCSALVRVCCEYAGIDVENFITSNETSKLMATGKFEKLTASKYTSQSDYLCRGDILNTKTKGHTVIVLSNGPKAEKTTVILPEETLKLGDRILKNGMEGEDVRELQSYLIQLDYDCGKWGADGDFGDATEMAVEKFQKNNKLDVDGEFGPKSLAVLQTLLKEEETSLPKKVKIFGGNCYVREKPDTSGKKIGIAYNEEKYNFGGETTDNGWNKIIFEKKEGWVSGKYSKLEE